MALSYLNHCGDGGYIFAACLTVLNIRLTTAYFKGDCLGAEFMRSFTMKAMNGKIRESDCKSKRSSHFPAGVQRLANARLY